jgi:hypothetical protein
MAYIPAAPAHVTTTVKTNTYPKALLLIAAARLFMLRLMEETTRTRRIPLKPLKNRKNRNIRNKRRAGISSEMPVSQFFLRNEIFAGARINFKKSQR